MSDLAEIRGFFDDQTNTITYLVWDPSTRQAVVIDPVLDYDPVDGTVDARSADRVLEAASENGLTITHVLETHAHADHLSAAPLFKARTGAKIGIGACDDKVEVAAPAAPAPVEGSCDLPAAHDTDLASLGVDETSTFRR